MADKPKLPEIPRVPTIARRAATDELKKLKGGEGATPGKPADKPTESMKEKYANVTTGGGKIQLAIMMDTSGSSYPYIKDMKGKSEELITDAVEHYGKGLEIGVVEYKDYLNDKMEGSFALKVTDFSKDPQPVLNHIRSMVSGPSNDTGDECLECALHEMNYSMGWTEDHTVTRLVVLMADAPPHTPKNCRHGRDYRDKVKFAAQRSIKIFCLLCVTGDTVDFSKLDEVARAAGGNFDDFRNIDRIMAWIAKTTMAAAATVSDPATAVDAIKLSMAKAKGESAEQAVKFLAGRKGEGQLTEGQKKLMKQLYPPPKANPPAKK